MDPAVVTFRAGELSRRQLAALMGSRRPLTEFPRQRLRQRVEAYLMTRGAAREVAQRGMDSFDGLASRQRWARLQILATRAMLNLVEQRFEAPDEEAVRQYYAQHQESYVRPVHYDLAAILLPVLGNDLRQSFEQGELLVHRLETAEITFEEAARSHSRHPSATAGGRLGWISRPALPRVYGVTVFKALRHLHDGEMSGLVQDEDRLWIFKLIATEGERPMTWDEAGPQAKDDLGVERVSAVDASVRQDWWAALGFTSP
jgi:hypothetical protein